MVERSNAIKLTEEGREKVRKAIDSKGLTLEQLAREADVSYVAVRRLVAGIPVTIDHVLPVLSCIGFSDPESVASMTNAQLSFGGKLFGPKIAMGNQNIIKHQHGC